MFSGFQHVLESLRRTSLIGVTQVSPSDRAASLVLGRSDTNRNIGIEPRKKTAAVAAVAVAAGRSMAVVFGYISIAYMEFRIVSDRPTIGEIYDEASNRRSNRHEKKTSEQRAEPSRARR